MIYAIIPARSGSKGVKNKNISLLNGVELIAYSIRFAQKLNVDKIICSTDSPLYADIAKKYGAEVPFLRSPKASSDIAMEEDILEDLYDKFDSNCMPYPELFVWLRPTFVFRDASAVKRCIDRMRQEPDLSACRTICETESRLYTIINERLIPSFDDHGKSMIRRQDVIKGYKVYSTDVFRGDPRNCSPNFLGNNVGYEIINKICGLDIDDSIDLKIVENILKYNRELVNEYL